MLCAALVACSPAAERDAGDGSTDVAASDANADGFSPSDAADVGADATVRAPIVAVPYDPAEARSSGSGTTYFTDRRAFDQPLAGMLASERTRHVTGQAIFQLDWVASAGANTSDRAGLGPTYHGTSCQACHLANGRGAPPLASGRALVSALVRVSIDGAGAHGEPLGLEIYGDQLQPRAIDGVPAEANVSVRYRELEGRYDDQTPYTLLAPELVIEPLLGALPANVRTSMRVASATIGLGLLEAIDEGALRAAQDPDDRDGDGISGRVNNVYSARAQRTVVGRFGWKANQPTLEQQNAAAMLGDIGITSALFTERNCPAPQRACANAAQSPQPELDRDRLDALTAYTRTVSVPARRDAQDPVVLRGKAVFTALRCDRCHRPEWTTGRSEIAALSEQRIFPYTDLLLHDMGDALADGRADFEASGREWRTPPLWGLGLLDTVSGHQRLLHDGRARGVDEAVLWHGGEAAWSRAQFVALPSEERDALRRFLRSL